MGKRKAGGSRSTTNTHTNPNKEETVERHKVKSQKKLSQKHGSTGMSQAATSENNAEPRYRIPFAIMRPKNVPAKLALHRVVSSIRSSQQFQASNPYQNFIDVSDEQIYDAEVAKYLKDSENGYLSDSESETDSRPGGDQNQSMDPENIYTGSYIFTLANTDSDSASWHAGIGRRGRQVDFLIATDQDADTVRGIHAVFSFCPETLLIKISRGSRAHLELTVNGEIVNNPTTFIHNKANVRMGALEYFFEYTSHSWTKSFKTDRANVLGKMKVFANPELAIIEPTPREDPKYLGEWNLQTPIGKGSSGTVVVAVNISSQIVAVKKRARDATIADYIAEEIAILQTVTKLADDHDEQRILRLHEVRYEFGKPEGRGDILGDVYCVLTPYCHYTLVSLLKDLNENKSPFMDLTKAWIVREILEGIAFLHGEGYLHGDIKPTNIGIRAKAEFHPIVPSVAALEDAFSIVLIDLDTAKNVGTKPTDRLPPIEDDGGTPGYISPEREMQPWGLPADVWAIGIIAYALHLDGPSWTDPRENPWRTGEGYEEEQSAWLKKYKNAMQELEEMHAEGDLKFADLLQELLAFEGPEAKDMARNRITAKRALDHYCWGKIFPKDGDNAQPLAKKVMISEDRKSTNDKGKGKGKESNVGKSK